MMKPFAITISLLTLSVAASAVADSSVAKEASPAIRAVQNKTAPRADGFTPMAAKSNHSGVSLAYQIEGTPEVGKPLTIRLQVASKAPALVTLRSSEGLASITPDAIDVPAGASAEHTVTVVPQAQGRFYLNVFSAANGRSSASAIAVQVGNQTAQFKPTGKLQVAPSGERVMAVPVK